MNTRRQSCDDVFPPHPTSLLAWEICEICLEFAELCRHSQLLSVLLFLQVPVDASLIYTDKLNTSLPPSPTADDGDSTDHQGRGAYFIAIHIKRQHDEAIPSRYCAGCRLWLTVPPHRAGGGTPCHLSHHPRLWLAI